jgi:hypothetical protein
VDKVVLVVTEVTQEAMEVARVATTMGITVVVTEAVMALTLALRTIMEMETTRNVATNRTDGSGADMPKLRIPQ